MKTINLNSTTKNRSKHSETKNTRLREAPYFKILLVLTAIICSALGGWAQSGNSCDSASAINFDTPLTIQINQSETWFKFYHNDSTTALRLTINGSNSASKITAMRVWKGNCNSLYLVSSYTTNVSDTVANLQCFSSGYSDYYYLQISSNIVNNEAIDVMAALEVLIDERCDWPDNTPFVGCNLVFNGGFDYKPSSINGFATFGAQSNGADFYNSTLTSGGSPCDLSFSSASWGVPFNRIGYQNSRSGAPQGCQKSFYTGIEADCENNQSPYRKEYLYQKLNHNLIAGVPYYAEFYVSLAEGCGRKAKNLGMFFCQYDNQTTSATATPLPNKITQKFNNSGLLFLPDGTNPDPQIKQTGYNTTSITTGKYNLNGWEKISGTFTPTTTGQYYIYIGDFAQHNSDPLAPDNSCTWYLYANQSAYYYIDDVSITVDPNAFSLSPITGCPGEEFTLSNSWNVPLTWNPSTWTNADFSDPANPTGTITTAETFTGSFTAALGCESNPQSVTVQLTPELECCIKHYKPIDSYTVGTVFDGNAPYNSLLSNSSETWTPTSNPFIIPGGSNSISVLYFSNQFIVPAGKTLTLSGMRIEFKPRIGECNIIQTGEKISVTSSGGRLIIRNGTGTSGTAAFGGKLYLTNSTLTSFSDCPGMWEGVEVWGNSYASGTHINQGRLYINTTNTAIPSQIMNAYFGVYAGKKFVYYPNNSTNITVAPNNGGVVICGNNAQPNNVAYFKNNLVDVYFHTYGSGMGSAYNYLQTSKFYHANFITDKALQGCSEPYSHAYLNDVQGVSFSSCTFANDIANGSQYPVLSAVGNMGIFAHKAMVNVNAAGLVLNNTNPSTGCKFYNLNYGIKCFNSSTTRTANVFVSTFTNNYRGIYIMNCQNASIDFNRFEVFPYTADNNSITAAYGLYTDFCRGFSIEGNYCTTVNNNKTANCYGMIINQTNPGRTCLVADEVYRNTFENISIGIQTQGNNSISANPVCPNTNNNNIGLVMRCNDFIQSSIGLYDIVVHNYTPPSGTAVLGNIAYQQGVSTASLNNTANNKFSHTFCPSDQSLALDDGQFFGNSENDYKVLATSYLVLGSSYNITSFDYADYNWVHNLRRPYCYTPNLPPVIYGLTHSSANFGLSTGTYIYNDALACPQKAGKTDHKEPILQAIADYKNMQDSLQLLINATLAEDTLALQTLYSQYSYAASSTNLAIDALKRFELNNANNSNLADTLLEIINNYDLPQAQDLQERLRIFLSKDDLTAAAAIIAQLRAIGGYDDFCDFMELLIGIGHTAANDSTLLGDPVALNTLQAVADDKTNPESAVAEELLRRLYGDKFEEWIEPNETSENRMAIIRNPVEKQSKLLLFPNPAYTSVTIKIKDATASQLQMLDAKGSVVYSCNVNAIQDVIINLNNYAAGIYCIVIKNANQTVIEKSKLSVVK